MNNRLDYINKFKNNQIAKLHLQNCRESYVNIDDSLKLIVENVKDAATQRAISLARTHLETSLFYAQKGIALKHENKDCHSE